MGHLALFSVLESQGNTLHLSALGCLLDTWHLLSALECLGDTGHLLSALECLWDYWHLSALESVARGPLAPYCAGMSWGHLAPS